MKIVDCGRHRFSRFVGIKVGVANFFLGNLGVANFYLGRSGLGGLWALEFGVANFFLGQSM